MTEIKKMHALIKKYQLKGQVRWIAAQTDRYRYIADTKGAFVQPTLSEAFGLIMIEAMNCGLPTFATNQGGPAEIIVDGVSDFHIDPNNGDESSSKIADFFEKCKTDSRYWNRMSQGGLKRIYECYTWKIYANKVLNMGSAYGFWKQLYKDQKQAKQRYIDIFYNLQFRKLAKNLPISEETIPTAPSKTPAPKAPPPPPSVKPKAEAEEQVMKSDFQLKFYKSNSNDPAHPYHSRSLAVRWLARSSLSVSLTVFVSGSALGLSLSLTHLSRSVLTLSLFVGGLGARKGSVLMFWTGSMSEEEDTTNPVVEEIESINNNMSTSNPTGPTPNPDAAGGSGKVTKQPKLRSKVWDHFTKFTDKEDGELKGKCNYCPKTYPCASKRYGTSTLTNHMLNCIHNPANVDSKQAQLSLKAREGEGSLTVHKFDQSYCRKKMVQMIVKDELAFKHVEGEGFIEFLEALQPKFKIPSRWTVSRDIHQLYLDERARLQEFFKTSELTGVDPFFRVDLRDLGLPTPADWEVVKTIIEILVVFYELTLRVSGQLYVTSHLLYHEIDTVGNMLREWVESPNPAIKDMAVKMQAKYDKYWGDPTKMNKLVYLAVVIDPRYKFAFISYHFKEEFGDEEGSRLAFDVKSALQNLYEHYQSLHRPKAQTQSVVNHEQDVVVSSPPAKKVKCNAKGG
ncbi:sucrose synthase 6 [Perilla frutescens var. hirtella]|nr:sucrose synthase 6 [Perilla frutescens var. hirtella]